MSEQIKKQEFSFKDTSKVSENGVLGILQGPCADIMNPTRNGRKYPQSLWEKVFSSQLVKQMFANGGIVGQLDHPTDRSQICSEKIAVLMPEAPKKGKDGLLHAIFKILDTPCGRIVHALAKAGVKLGVSSRGQGDTYIDDNGQERVDQSTYDFKCFDIVWIPSVAAARLSLVTQSLDSESSKIKMNLTQALNRSSQKDKAIMLETLKHINIDYSPEMVNNKQDNSTTNQKSEVINNESTLLTNKLQECLLEKQNLQKQLKSLQQKLSVCYTQGKKNEEMLDKYRKSISILTEKLKSNESEKSKVSKLSFELSNKDKKIASLIEKLEQSKTNYQNQLKIAKKSNLQESMGNKKKLSQMIESLNTKKQEVRNLKVKVKKLDETIVSLQQEAKENKKVLSQQLGRVKQDLQTSKIQYHQNLNEQKRLVQKYKATANKAVDKYISLRANQLGVQSSDIKSKLTGNYSFNDIDTICEGLKQYKLNINKLPFNVSRYQQNKPVRVKITQAKESILDKNQSFDDDVDDQLYSLAGLK